MAKKHEIRFTVDSAAEAKRMKKHLEEWAYEGIEVIDLTPCDAVLHHGPGHQSTAECEATGKHIIHFSHMVPSCYNGYAEWADKEADPDGNVYI